MTSRLFKLGQSRTRDRIIDTLIKHGADQLIKNHKNKIPSEINLHYDYLEMRSKPKR